MPKTPAEMYEAVIRNLPKNTGRTLDEWVALTKKSAPKTTAARIAWLRDAHAVPNLASKLIVRALEGTPDEYAVGPDALLDAQYAGKKAALRPICDAVLAEARKLDARLSPCRTYVSIIRTRQFAAIKPTTQTRVDLRLALGDTEPTGRLELAKSLGMSDRITHVIALRLTKDVDAEVRKWLKNAHEIGG